MQKIGSIPNTRADSNGEFTDGNVAGGVPPTILPAEWFNTIQRELMSILTAAEIEADSDVFNQVLLSIQKLVSDGIPELKDASLTQKGVVQLSSATNSTSEALAATPKAIKAAIDAALPVGGTAKAAEKLATARKISGVDFDGTKDITLPFINTTDTNIQLAGNLGVKNLQVHPMGSNPTEGGQIDLFDKTDVVASFIDIDTNGNFRIVISDIGVALAINRLTGQVTINKTTAINGELSASGSITTVNGNIVTTNGNIAAGGRADITSDIRGGRVLSKSDVVVGEGQAGGYATINSTGNIAGSQWGNGWLSTRTARAFAVFSGTSGAVSGSVGVSSVTRNSVGNYTIVFSSAMPGTYAVFVGTDTSNRLDIHQPSVQSKTATSFQLLTPSDGGTSYGLTDLATVQIVVFSTGT
ncbi:phage tail protein [Yersinia enterocolitica]